ncbi:hypothetical protein BH18THE1_BH18THE1_01880 [soil metagenome]
MLNGQLIEMNLNARSNSIEGQVMKKLKLTQANYHFRSFSNDKIYLCILIPIMRREKSKRS